MASRLSPVIALILVVIAWAPAGGTSTHPDTPDPVARVNGEPVARDEWRRLIADTAMRDRLAHELGVAEPDEKQLERVAVELLIKRRLVLQDARRRNLTVSDGEVDEAVSRLRRGFPDLKAFGLWLKARGLTERSLFEAIRDELLVARVRATVVGGIRVTDDDIARYYRARKAEFMTAGAVRLRMITERDAAGREAGWANVDALPPSLRVAVSALNVGDTSGPVQVDSALVVVRLEERRPGRAKTLSEARPEIERQLTAARQRPVLRAWLAEQRSRASIEVFLPRGVAD